MIRSPSSHSNPVLDAYADPNQYIWSAPYLRVKPMLVLKSPRFSRPVEPKNVYRGAGELIQ